MLAAECPDLSFERTLFQPECFHIVDLWVGIDQKIETQGLLQLRQFGDRFLLAAEVLFQHVTEDGIGSVLKLGRRFAKAFAAQSI